MTIHITLRDEIVVDFGFEGDTAIVTTAAASLFGEVILGQKYESIFSMTYKDIREMLGMDVSPKRQIAACLALLATRNGLHEYLKDGKNDDFSDVLPDD